MPSLAPIVGRNMRPISRCSGVVAISALMRWMPAVSLIAGSFCGPLCAAAAAAIPSASTAARQDFELSFIVGHPT